MNDDITVRELELVAAILDALHNAWLAAIEEENADYIDGYLDAVDIVNDVLDKRGFDAELPWVPELEED